MKAQQWNRLLAGAIVASILCVSLIGCGGGKDDPTSVALRPPKVQPQGGGGNGGDPVKTPEDNDAPPPKAGGTGKIVGKILLDEADAVPEPSFLFPVGKAPVDTGFCGSKMAIKNETLLVNPMTRGVHNVFVYLEKMPKGGKKEIESQSEWPGQGGEGLILDQDNCTYAPHAMIVPAGQEFTAKSQDTVVHSYRGSPIKNRDFNLTIPSKGTLKVKPFSRAEKYPVPISCATHSWMSGYQLPLDHPYAAVTNEKGEFIISDLPTGEHKFIIWHENKGVIEERPISVDAGDNPEEITFRLSQLKK